MKIHTFDARDFMMWEAIFGVPSNKNVDLIFTAIRGLYEQMLDDLERQKINYDSLKNILTPQKDKREIGFIFDSQCINDTSYGRVIAENFYEIFDK